MKKLLSLCLISAMMLAFGVCATADDISQVEVTYTADEHYELTIPPSQNMGDGMAVAGTVAANAVRLAEGTSLHVNMQSANGFSLVCGDSSIDYSVSANGSAVANGSDVLVVEAGNTAGSTSLVFSTDAARVANATVVGAHTDTISFTADVLTEISDEGVPMAEPSEQNGVPAMAVALLSVLILAMIALLDVSGRRGRKEV